MNAIDSTAERNARMSALGQYFRWLLKYYTSAELAEMSDEPEPVSLRQIFVRMRVDKEELAEAAMAGPTEVAEKETEANLPGVDAFDLLQREPFVCLSGLPGSGKTTLVKALLVELCAQYPSRLRSALAGTRGIAPVPLLLRELSDLDKAKTLDDVLAAWWRNLEKRASQGDALDIERLKICFSPTGDAFPLLLLFDGIDETGGRDIRQQILEIAKEAARRGYRVVVTGRPNGFEDCKLVENVVSPSYDGEPDDTSDGPLHYISSNTIGLYRLLPMAWPQITTFINRWYQLRPEWEIKRREGAEHFQQALQDNNRDYLLPLARRPIFLTLMALVHCTRNEMPYGRAELYEAIVDLYLNRQERHRQLNRSVKGKTLKPWPALDKRRVLSHIAYQSQLKGSRQQQQKSDERRILWPRAELLELIRAYLHGKSDFGIAPDEAEDLLEYYLHPAGLLIEAREAEISFAHLSFQEYLCAEDIQRRLTGLKAEKIFREELLANLAKPGWDEVGLLLLVIHKSRSEDGHLELLDLLDEKDESHACLWLQAVCGKELALSSNQRLGLLSKLVAWCLRHPYAYLPSIWLQQECVAELAEPGLRLLLHLLRKKCPDEELAWLERLDAADRLHRLLALVCDSRWGCRDDDVKPISSADLEHALVDNLVSESLLWDRICDGNVSNDLPRPTEVGLCLDALLLPEGELWRRALSLVPVDAWLLQGESCGDTWSYEVFSQPVVLLAVYPNSALPPRARLAIGLYQAVLLAEQGGCELHRLWRTRALLQEQSLPLSWSRMLNLLRSRTFALSLRGALWRPLLRSKALSLSKSQSPSLLSSWVRTRPWPLPRLSKMLDACEKRISKVNPTYLETLALTFERFSYQYAACDWFQEQAGNPELMHSRGLRPGEPLPKSLGLFDERGLPFDRQRQANWQGLRAWLDEDDEVLGFFFPEGLAAEDEAVLRQDLAILKRQPWSPQAFVQATLDHWPTGEDLDISYAEAERRMIAACEALLRTADR